MGSDQRDLVLSAAPAAYAAARAAVEVAKADANHAINDDIDFIEPEQTPEGRSLLAGWLIARPLWSDGIPEQISVAWSRLKAMLLARECEHWEVWTVWYEDRLAGHPADSNLEFARELLPNGLWDEDAKTVNAEIRRLIDEHKRAEAPIEPVPQQGAGPHFMLSADGPIALAPPSEIDVDGNNIGRIRQLLPLARRAAERLRSQLNRNEQRELAEDVYAYRAAIADDTAIAWGTVSGLGVMLEDAATAAEHPAGDQMRPRLEDAPKAALASLLTLHGPLILATAEGRELTEQANRMRLTRGEQAKLRATAKAVLAPLRHDREVIDEPAAELADKAADTIGEGRHPERGRVFGVATVKHLMTLVVPAATLASIAAVRAYVGTAAGGLIGGVVSGVLGGTIGGVGSFVATERERVRQAARALSTEWTELIEQGGFRHGHQGPPTRVVPGLRHRKRGAATPLRKRGFRDALDARLYRFCRRHEGRKREAAAALAAVIPAEAGIHLVTDRAVDECVPAFAGTAMRGG